MKKKQSSTPENCKKLKIVVKIGNLKVGFSP